MASSSDGSMTSINLENVYPGGCVNAFFFPFLLHFSPIFFYLSLPCFVLCFVEFSFIFFIQLCPLFVPFLSCLCPILLLLSCFCAIFLFFHCSLFSLYFIYLSVLTFFSSIIPDFSYSCPILTDFCPIINFPYYYPILSYFLSCLSNFLFFFLFFYLCA